MSVTTSRPGVSAAASAGGRSDETPSDTSRSVERRIERLLLVAASVAAGAAILYFGLLGLDYYLRPLTERARHPLYWQLKPGGSLGLRFGYLGAGMMTLLLLYSVRKRLPALRRVGALRTWLNWHIFLGIYGPLFIVLHSSLKVGGLVSLSFWSMVAVALSGVLGRFLYRQIPRSVGGDELSRLEITSEDERLADVLASRWRLDPDRVAEVRRIAASGTTSFGGRVSGASLLGLLFRLPFDGLLLRARVARQARHWSDLDPATRTRARVAALELARAHRRLLLLDAVRRLFRAWHVFHKPFALILYTLMVVHVAIAWMTGYGPLGT